MHTAGCLIYEADIRTDSSEMTVNPDGDVSPSARSVSASTASDPSLGKRYSKIFLQINDVVSVGDLGTDSFHDVNPAACDFLEYLLEDLLSMYLEDIHRDDIDWVREECISQLCLEGSRFTDDLFCLTEDGKEVPTEIFGASLDVGGDGDFEW